jgi:hypothetical protein
MLVHNKLRITLTNQEADDLSSILRDFFRYMEELKLGENSTRTELAAELILDLEHAILKRK